jgi:histidinol-phosphate aminotransferase
MSQSETPATPPSGRPAPKPWINALHAYVPGKSTGTDGRALTKLSANENPLGTSVYARHVLMTDPLAMGYSTYPDPDCVELRQAIGSAHGLNPAQIVCGTGSDELLNLIAQGYAGVGDEIIHVRYGFAVYDIATRRIGATPVVVSDKDYATDVDAILAAVTDKTRVVFVANPNNPTGTLTAPDEIRRLHAGLRGDILLVLDQAYAEYLAPTEAATAFALAESADNVLVTRTFSKIYGLAAERIGWAFGAVGLIETLNKIRGPFNVTAKGQKAAIAALGDKNFVLSSQLANERGLAKFTSDMNALSNHGVRVVPSAANFALVLFEGVVSAETVYHTLMDGGYITRHLPNQGLAHGLRITIGTEAQMQDVTAIIRACLEGNS